MKPTIKFGGYGLAVGPYTRSSNGVCIQRIAVKLLTINPVIPVGNGTMRHYKAVNPRAIMPCATLRDGA